MVLDRAPFECPECGRETARAGNNWVFTCTKCDITWLRSDSQEIRIINKAVDELENLKLEMKEEYPDGQG